MESSSQVARSVVSSLFRRMTRSREAEDTESNSHVSGVGSHVSGMRSHVSEVGSQAMRDVKERTKRTMTKL